MNKKSILSLTLIVAAAPIIGVCQSLPDDTSTTAPIQPEHSEDNDGASCEDASSTETASRVIRRSKAIEINLEANRTATFNFIFSAGALVTVTGNTSEWQGDVNGRVRAIGNAHINGKPVALIIARLKDTNTVTHICPGQTSLTNEPVMSFEVYPRNDADITDADIYALKLSLQTFLSTSYQKVRQNALEDAVAKLPKGCLCAEESPSENTVLP